jgi:predicted phage terminase large subunit-like protein
MNRDDQDFVNAALRSDFVAFVHRCFLTLNPGASFQLNWHIEAIAYELQKVLAGEETRLIVNGPPRSLKSIIVSVAFVAFVLGHQPWRRIICISYGGELSAKHAADFRSIVTSDWYQRAFPKMRISRNLEDHAKRYQPQWVLIEDASTGSSLSQELSLIYFGGITQLVPIEHDKIGRLYVNQAKFATGKVRLPRRASFLPIVEAELLTFPQGKTDDIVDSITQAGFLRYEL